MEKTLDMLSLNLYKNNRKRFVCVFNFMFTVNQVKSFIRLFEGSIKNPEIDSTSAVGQEKEKIVCD